MIPPSWSTPCAWSAQSVTHQPASFRMLDIAGMLAGAPARASGPIGAAVQTRRSSPDVGRQKPSASSVTCPRCLPRGFLVHRVLGHFVSRLRGQGLHPHHRGSPCLARVGIASGQVPPSVQQTHINDVPWFLQDRQRFLTVKRGPPRVGAGRSDHEIRFRKSIKIFNDVTGTPVNLQITEFRWFRARVTAD